jgi:hypothetical protein
MCHVATSHAFKITLALRYSTAISGQCELDSYYIISQQ